MIETVFFSFPGKKKIKFHMCCKNTDSVMVVDVVIIEVGDMVDSEDMLLCRIWREGEQEV